jgi:hypothetical protein
MSAIILILIYKLFYFYFYQTTKMFQNPKLFKWMCIHIKILDKFGFHF